MCRDQVLATLLHERRIASDRVSGCSWMLLPIRATLSCRWSCRDSFRLSLLIMGQWLPERLRLLHRPRRSCWNTASKPGPGDTRRST